MAVFADRGGALSIDRKKGWYFLGLRYLFFRKTSIKKYNLVFVVTVIFSFLFGN
jgi:hypothetical protein